MLLGQDWCLFLISVSVLALFLLALKWATVTLILKKPSLDSSVLNNFRPISVLPFISKVLEKIVFEQLQSFLSCNGISEMFQSGFKSVHSTKIALLRVLNSIFFIYRLWSSCF